jgi:hypothetical protein
MSARLAQGGRLRVAMTAALVGSEPFAAVVTPARPIQSG